MDYDGKLVIGTALDTKGLEKQLRDEEKQLEKYQEEHKVMGETKLEIETNIEQVEKDMNGWKESIDETANKITNLKKQIEDIRVQRQSMEFGSPEDKALAEQQSELEKQYREALESQEQYKSGLKEVTAEYNNQKSKLDEINKQLLDNEQNQRNTTASIRETNNELQKRYAYEDIGDKIQEINKGLSGIVKKTGRWLLAIFGVRSMFAFIRQSMNTIAQDDPQLKADIDYIKNALAYTIEPIVRKIVEWAKQILTFIGAIIYKWTGYNIFKDANKHLEKAKQKANALQKTMAKFDEMNTLNKQNESSPDPSWNFALDVEGFNFDKAYNSIDKALSKIKNKFNTTFDEIQENYMNAMLDAGASQDLIDYWYNTTEDIQGIINGIGTTFRGVFDIIWGVITGDTPKIWQGVDRLCTGINEIVVNLFKLIKDAFLLALIYMRDLGAKIHNWVDEHIYKPIRDTFKAMFDWVVNGFVNTWNNVMNGIQRFKSWVGNVFSSIVDMFKNIGTKVGDAIGSAFKGVLNFVLEKAEKILNKPIEAINSLLGVINEIPGIHLSKLNKMSFPRLASGGILNNPGKGVYVGGAMVGESGPEAVIPFTNTQQMELIGQAIGKWITINANITNTMNGRVISRELQKIQNENDFAFNR